VSGPKQSEWEVLENARLEAARREAAAREVDSLSNQIRSAVAGLRKRREDVAARLETDRARTCARIGEASTTSSLMAVAADLRRQLAEAADAIASADNVERFATSLRALRDERRAGRPAAAGSEEEMETRQRKVAALLERVPATAEGESSAIHRIAAEMLRCPPGMVRALEMELRVELQALQRRSAERAKAAVETARLRSELAGFEDEEAGRLRERLAASEEGRVPLTAEVRAAVASALPRLRAAADRRYAAEVLSEEFRALGYEVGEDFVTTFVRGGETRLTHPARSPYSVEMEIDPTAAALRAELVASPESSRLSEEERTRRDYAAETGWCTDLAHALANAETRNVRHRLRARTPAGASRVRIAGEKQGAGAKRAGVKRGLGAAREL
jgi:hypothetical protein